MSRPRIKRFILHPLLRGLTGFPLALAGLLGTPFGLAGFPAAGQRRLAHGLGTVKPDGRPRPKNGRSALLSLVTLIPSVIAFAIAAICLLTVFTGYMYPIRPGVVEYISEPLTPQKGLVGAWAAGP